MQVAQGAAMPTLILTPRMTDDSIALWRAAGRLGWNVDRMTRFILPDDYPPLDDPVLYVEGLTAPLIAEQLGLSISEPPVDWLVTLPERYRKREIRMMPLREAKTLTERWFMKPPNDKSFEAAVRIGAELPDGFDPDSPVLVSECVRWRVEYRCFVLDRQVRTCSIYLRDGQLQRDFGFAAPDEEVADMLAFARSMLADPEVRLHDAAVIDIGMIEGRGWAVVEQNAPWGSGLYGSDAEEALRVIERSMRP
jgi:hypothetical protein